MARPPALFVGIDLGTTNSALAWAGDHGPVAVFDVPQLVAAGEIGRDATLPSFLYLPSPEEVAAGLVPAPWGGHSDVVAGRFARDHGALVPASQIASAKSWLSNAAVDREAPLLPWMDDAPRRLSAVEASSRLLTHLRQAWDHEHAAGEPAPLGRQSIALTVPASFDEEARELTLQAARDAGLPGVVLLEEPLAALYAWMAAHPGHLASAILPGATILVCDVGGGTTDFSLIRASIEGEALAFERVAIGEHLLLGGDNLDFALAALVEQRLGGPAAGLSLAQRQILRRKCSGAKERLLSEPELERLPVTLPGGGRRLIGGGLTADLTRDDVVRTLCDGFLPLTDPDDLPPRRRRAGLRELGLPFEGEPAITRHLAAFLARAGQASGAGRPAVPDAVLFNGGFFEPPLARERVLDALAAWSGRRPQPLENPRPAAAVAIGAACYARLRRNPAAAGRQLIRAAAARAYYIGVETGADTPSGASAVCVLPRGTEEGSRVTIDRPFSAVANQPSAFTLYSSLTRTDSLNAVVSIDEAGDDMTRLAPLVTALRYGRRSRRVPLPVRLVALHGETGTLELWCESLTTDHRWRLSFSLRHAGPEAADDDEGEGEAAVTSIVIGEPELEQAKSIVREAFGQAGAGAEPSIAPGPVTGALENALGHPKAAWPLPVLRALADELIASMEGRRQSAAHEARWLNLAGFCVRPGYGASADPWRVSELRKVYAAGLTFARDVQCQVEWLVLWQRAAGGFSPGQQRELAQRIAGQIGIGAKKGPRLNAQIEREGWRLLAALERLDPAQRMKLGEELVARVERDPRNAARAWALGRLGAREPAYGPLNSVVPPGAAGQWIGRLLALKVLTADVAAAIVQIGALTGDPARDVPEVIRRDARRRLAATGMADAALAPLETITPPDRRTATDASGEALPEGLRLEREGTEVVWTKSST